MSSKHEDENNEEQDSVNDDKVGCFSAFWNEFKPCQPWFRVKEPFTKRTLDIPATFGPSDLVARLCKVLICSYAISTQVVALVQTASLSFYYAFFTSWALAFAVLYLITSLVNSIVPPTQPKGTRVQGRLKWTWLIFILASFSQALATLLFWTLVYEPGNSVAYVDVATHGIVFVTVLIEGFLVNRIPLRWMHMWAALAISLLYLFWSFLHGPVVFDIGNPTTQDNDPDTNDDAIYANLSWSKDDLASTSATAAIVYFVVVPVIFGVLRAVSLWNFPCCCTADRRRYIRTARDLKNDEENAETGEVRAVVYNNGSDPEHDEEESENEPV